MLSTLLCLVSSAKALLATKCCTMMPPVLLAVRPAIQLPIDPFLNLRAAESRSFSSCQTPFLLQRASLVASHIVVLLSARASVQRKLFDLLHF